MEQTSWSLVDEPLGHVFWIPSQVIKSLLRMKSGSSGDRNPRPSNDDYINVLPDFLCQLFFDAHWIKSYITLRVYQLWSYNKLYFSALFSKFTQLFVSDMRDWREAVWWSWPWQRLWRTSFWPKPPMQLKSGQRFNPFLSIALDHLSYISKVIGSWIL